MLKFLIKISLFLTVLPSSFSLASEIKNASEKKELRIAVNTEFESIHPLLNTMMAAILVQNASLRPLVALDGKGQAVPHIIKEVPSFQNGLVSFKDPKEKKGLKIKIQIRDEAKWGDGVPVTCDDVKLSWEIGNSPNSAIAAADDYRNIEAVEIEAGKPKNCVLSFKEARFNVLSALPAVISSHIERPIFEKYKDKPQAYDRNSAYVRDPRNPGLYSGPFLIKEVKSGSHVQLEPNPYFYGKAPQIQKLIFKFIPNTASMESHLRTGSVNLLSSSSLSFDQMMDLKAKIEKEKLPFRLVAVDGGVFTHIDLNLQNPILKDVRVRKALMLAINRQEINRSFFYDQFKIAPHFSQPQDSWYTDKAEDFVSYRFERRKAAHLLDDAGWKMSSDGIRMKDGHKLNLTMSGPADNKLSETMQVYFQSAWKQIGVEMNIKNQAGRVFFSEILKKRKFDMALYSYVNDPNSIYKTVFHSSAIPSENNSWVGSNRTGWSNKKVDSLLDQAEVEFDTGKQRSLMREVLREFTEEVPMIPLFFRPTVSVIPAGLSFYQASGNTSSEYLSVENWRL